MTNRPQATLAFCLYKYFPYGGLQRDMLRIALACQRRGYAIHIYTTRWIGEAPPGLILHRHNPGGLTNHGRVRRYHAWVAGELAAHRPACVVGFNKMPGLDVYFAADGCYVKAARHKSIWFDRLTGRYGLYARFERAVFSRSSQTEIMLIAETQLGDFEKTYGTPSSRMHLLPPWISPDRVIPENREQTRRAVRAALGCGDEDVLLLQVGSDFRRKGVDRTLLALAALPDAWRSRTRVAVVGDDRPGSYRRLAKRLGLSEAAIFLGARDDVMELMAGADLLLHPARSEPAGVVLIEALVSGLPVLCTGRCGHAGHIRQARAGVVLPNPFDQAELNRCLLDILTGGRLPSYSAGALAYTAEMDLYAMPERAADIIETAVGRKPDSFERP